MDADKPRTAADVPQLLFFFFSFFPQWRGGGRERKRAPVALPPKRFYLTQARKEPREGRKYASFYYLFCSSFIATTNPSSPLLRSILLLSLFFPWRIQDFVSSRDAPPEDGGSAHRHQIAGRRPGVKVHRRRGRSGERLFFVLQFSFLLNWSCAWDSLGGILILEQRFLFLFLVWFS